MTEAEKLDRREAEHRYVDKKMRQRGASGKSVARDLWYMLRLTLRSVRHACDEDRAAQLVRQLAYLTRTYDCGSLDDKYQGMNG